MLDLSYLQIFYEVAKRGRFSEAARELHISQSALSRSVALLEESQGVKLFDRSKTGVQLTKIGMEVFRNCQTLFQTVGKIEQVCRGLDEKPEGPLKFATADHIMNNLLVEPLQNFKREYSDVIPIVSVGSPDEVEAAILDGRAEFGLLYAKIRSPQIENEPLREDSMALVVHPEIWKKCRRANHASTLDEVLNSFGYITSIDAFRQARPSRVLKELFGRMPPIAIEVNGQESQKRVCLAQGGVAYLARFLVEKELNNGSLHEIKVEDIHSFYLWLSTKKSQPLSVTAQTFIAGLRKRWSL